MHAQHLKSDASLPSAKLDRRRGRHWSGHHHRPGCNVHHISNGSLHVRHFDQCNGKGGGTYNMISRFLGPAFETAIEIIFETANTVAVSRHTIGFYDSLNDLLASLELRMWVMVPTTFALFAHLGHVIRFIYCSVYIIVMIGMGWYTLPHKLIIWTTN